MYSSPYSQNPNSFSTQQINQQKSAYSCSKNKILTFSQCLRAQKYQFPFTFTLKCESMMNKQGQIDSKLKCIGTLSYENGRPVDLKKYRYVLMAYQKNLSQFYTIDRQTYNLRFTIIISKNVDGQNRQYNQLSQQQYSEIWSKFQENKKCLSIFLIKLGLVSTKEMSYNRLRNIMAKKMIKNKMDNIINLHSTKYQDGYPYSGDCGTSNAGSAIFSANNYSQKQQICSGKSQKSTNISQSTSMFCQSSHTISASKSTNKQYRACCRQQHLTSQQNYPNIGRFNTPIIPVQSIQIKKCILNQQQNLGGYFSVRSYDTVVEVVTEEGTYDCDGQQQNIQGICAEQQQKQAKQKRKYKNTYKCNAKLAIKHLRRQLQTTPKYLKKLSHQLSIISKIKNNQYIPRYYQIQSQPTTSAPQQSKSKQNQSKSAIQVYDNEYEMDLEMQLNKVNSVSVSRDDRMVEQNCMREEDYEHGHRDNSGSNRDGDSSQDIKRILKNSIFMESLPISLKQILANDMFCNHHQIIKQLIKAICTLHESGIVHRDIKPGNIMFNNRGELKLIDFSQSIQCWRKLQANPSLNASIGFTLPYSPIECSKVCPQGYSNMKIDNWSVGMTVCQILNGQLPVSYCKSMSSSIKSGWVTQQFHWCLNLRTNSMYDTMMLPIKILCLNLLSFKSQDRLCLQSFLSMLEYYQRQFLQGQ